MEKEIRTYSPENVSEFRAFESEDGKKIIEGYASRFDQKSRFLTERGKSFFEVIKRGAFSEVLSKNPDVIMNLNHNRNQIMARTKSGTLQLSEDENGLKYRFEVPNVSYALDTWELVKRGDLFESSFAFNITEKDQAFSKDENGNAVRTISRINNLFDTAICTDGAYPNTVVAARSIEEMEKSEEELKLEEEKKRAESNATVNSRKKLNEDFITRIYIKRNWERKKSRNA